jgi:formylglycine-generating enzyme
MNKQRFIRLITLSMSAFAMVFLLESCGMLGGKSGSKSKGKASSSKSSKGGKKSKKSKDVGIRAGEIVATGRPDYKQDTPYGMVLIPSGSFMMGQADEDVAQTQVSFNRRVTVSSFYMDDAEISNHEYRQFVTALMTDSLSVLGEEEIMSKYYPDTTVWKKDFTYHNGDPMLEYYYAHPAFDKYPVVGVSWRSARYFAKWRTSLYNDHRSKEGLFASPEFTLPTETQWEWAARGGRSSAKYPWGNPYVANGKGCFLANFKPQRGNYDADGYPYTAPTNAYNANDYGLYNMAGNVAEWTLDAFAENATVINWDMNPKNDNPDEPRKIVRGGSWKDVAYFLETGTRSWEIETNKRSFIGFRCIVENLSGRAATKSKRK